MQPAQRHRLLLGVAVAAVLALTLGPPLWLIGYEAWRSRPVPAPVRYPRQGRIGLTVDPREEGVVAVEQGADLVLHWLICDDAPDPLPVTAARNFRSTAGHVVPIVAGQRTLQPGCHELVNRQVGLTDDLLPGYRWYLEGTATVVYRGRTWQVPYRTDEFLVLPRSTTP